MPTTRKLAAHIVEGDVLVTTLGDGSTSRRVVVEVDHLVNKAGSTVIRTATRAGSRPSGSVICHPMTPLTIEHPSTAGD